MKAKPGSGRRQRRTNGKASGPSKVLSKLTRREWLARVGETALLGVGGAEWATGASRAMATASPGSVPLPAGLYEPSLDCLTHALESSFRFRSVPAGAPTDYVQPRTGPYRPQFFRQSEFKTLRRMVRVMLGESAQDSVRGETMGETCDEIAEWIDLSVAQSAAVREAALELSPQHRNLAVHYYGAEAVRRLETEDPQKAWREGLDWFRAESQRRFGRTLSGLGTGRLRRLLELASDVQRDLSAPNAGTELFRLLKAEVIRGFYTSGRGLHELGYKGNAFYAASPGCPKGKPAGAR